MRDTIETRREIIETCLWMHEQGLVFGTWGNISARLDDGNILITPSRVPYELMQPKDLVVLAPDGNTVSGIRLSTSERELHRGILNAKKDVGVIIHTHSPYAMAAAARNEGIPVISEEMCQIIGGAIPLTHEFVPSQEHIRLGEMTVKSLTSANALLIRNHGPICFGRDLAEARVCCQIVEKSCKIYLQLLASGGINTIPQEFVDAGRDYYINSYGKS